MTVLLVTYLLAQSGVSPVGSSHAEVTPELVCVVKAALSPPRSRGVRHRRRWSARKCERVAAALRTSDRPAELFAICINESDLRERATVWVTPWKVDAGLCGVRCLLGADGRCTNGHVRGKSLSDLYDPSVNAAVAAQILADKGTASRYAGETIDRGYGSRVKVLVSALRGIRVETKSSRLRNHASKILRALGGGPSS